MYIVYVLQNNYFIYFFVCIILRPSYIVSVNTFCHHVSPAYSVFVWTLCLIFYHYLVRWFSELNYWSESNFCAVLSFIWVLCLVMPIIPSPLRAGAFFCNCHPVTEGTNLRPVKAVRRDDRFLSLALKWILLEKHAYRAFHWPRYACINLSDVY